MRACLDRAFDLVDSRAAGALHACLESEKLIVSKPRDIIQPSDHVIFQHTALLTSVGRLKYVVA